MNNNQEEANRLFFDSDSAREPTRKTGIELDWLQRSDTNTMSATVDNTVANAVVNVKDLDNRGITFWLAEGVTTEIMRKILITDGMTISYTIYMINDRVDVNDNRH